MNRPKRTVKQKISWWWNTRIRSIWTVLLPGLKSAKSEHREALSFSNSGAPLAGESSQPGKITVILTAYKRTQYLSMQVEAIKKQSVAATEIWLWCNDSDEQLEDYSALVDRVVVSNSNWKFWGRFALANMARTEYVAFFDDDILPEPEWFKNCLETLAGGTEGILGGSGVILPKEGGYSSKHKVGWNGHHYENATRVDLVGHAWFLRKEHLKYLWQEEPASWENGEDIHLSSCALRFGGIKTFVPPHPESQPTLWSCRPDFGKRVAKVAATHKSEGHHPIRGAMVDQYRSDGWKIVSEIQEGQ